MGLWNVAFSGGQIRGYVGRMSATSGTFKSKYHSGTRGSTIANRSTQAIIYRISRPIWQIDTPTVSIVEMKTHVSSTEYHLVVSWTKGTDTLKVGIMDASGHFVNGIPIDEVYRDNAGGKHAHAMLWLPQIFKQEADTEFADALRNLENDWVSAGQLTASPNLFVACDNLYYTRSDYDIDAVEIVTTAADLDIAPGMMMQGYNGADPTDSHLHTFLAPIIPPTAASRTRRSRRAVATPPSSGHSDFFTKYQLPWKKALSKEHAAEIPQFDPNEVEISPEIEHIAEVVYGEYGSKRPVNNVLLFGEAGAGKSTGAQLLAQAFGLPYRYFNGSLNAEESDMKGAFLPTEDGKFLFLTTEFLKCAKYGGIIEIMEPNFMKPGALGALNSFLAPPYKMVAGNGEVVERHPNCIVIATTNVKYAGTMPMNESVIDRFQIIQEIEKLTKEQLRSIVVRETGFADIALLDKLIDAVDKMSTKIREEDIPGVCSTRKLIDWARDVKYSRDPKASAWRTVLPGISLEKDVQEEIFNTCLNPVF